MAEYIDREQLLELINEDCKYKNPTNEYTRGCNEVCDWAIKTIKNIPTADVVPKSEVENALDKLLKQIGGIADNNKRWADAMIDDAYARLRYEGIQKGALLAMLRIAELKKKYTEGET